MIFRHPDHQCRRLEDDTTPETGRRTQESINRQIVDPADILIAVFSARLGTPTGKAKSGTVEEIERFLRANKRVMVYFAKRRASADTASSFEYKRLMSFKERFRRTALYFEYASIGALAAHVSDDLVRLVREPTAGDSLRRLSGFSTEGVLLSSPEHLYKMASQAIDSCHRRKNAPRVLRLAALHGLNTDLRWEEPPELSKLFRAFDARLFKCICSGEWAVQMLVNITNAERLKNYQGLLKKAGRRGVFDLRAIVPTQSTLPLICPLVLGDSDLFLATDHPGYHRAFSGIHLKGTRFADWGSQYFASLWNGAPFHLRTGTRDNARELRRLKAELGKRRSQ